MESIKNSINNTCHRPVVVVHGGAWAIPDDKVEASLEGVRVAARAAWAVLSKGGRALDAVEAAVCALEDDPVFDAGTGAVLTSAGTVELDALIMEGMEHGKSLGTGAVACVQNVKNPIRLARAVMEKTEHILLVGEGAGAFADEVGVPRASLDELVTPAAIQEWETYKKYHKTVGSLFALKNPGHDTVGAVVLDSEGNLAAGTSTGGITAKRVGRVGDSPLVGCGGYADNSSAAVSCTGYGEAIAKVCLAKSVADGVSSGLSPQISAEKCLERMACRVGGAGGVISVSKDGETGVAFTSERMAWAVMREGAGGTCGLLPSQLLPFN